MTTLDRRDALHMMALPLAALALAGRPGLLLAQEGAAADRRWWKEAVVYQIYPRSFMDSNGDGIGDLPGILSKLDYIAALGIDVVWLCPHYPSPNVDNGYDVSDYRAVSPLFGTMADFDALVAGLKARGIHLILDLVANHTSDRHPWFERSRSARDAPGRDYYIWRDGVNGRPPNNYPSLFGGPAWTRDDATGQYYLHLFAPQQPDLNWDHPKVRAEVYQIMRFWLDRGVSGFRLDAITFISKRPGLLDLTPDELRDPTRVYADGPHRDDYLREMDREVLSRTDAMTVGEAGGVSAEGARAMTDPRRHELDMVFTFALIGIARDGETPSALLPEMRRIIAERDRAAGADGWVASYLANHDQPRSLSHFGDPDPGWRTASAKVLATLLLTQRATPFVYQGEELGMANYPFTSIDQFADVAAKREWRERVESGAVPAEVELDKLRRTGRDNARTPMQWTAGPQAGFTTGTPWLPVNPDARDVNAADELVDPNSVLSFYRRLIALRKRVPALVYGAYRDIDPNHPAVFGYTRTLPDAACLVLMNFGREAIAYRLPRGVNAGETLLSSEAGDEARSGAVVALAGWQSLTLSTASKP